MHEMDGGSGARFSVLVASVVGDPRWRGHGGARTRQQSNQAHHDGDDDNAYERLVVAPSANPREAQHRRESASHLGYSSGEGFPGTLTDRSTRVIADYLNLNHPGLTKVFDYGIGTGTGVMRLCAHMPTITRAYGVEIARTPALQAAAHLAHVPTLVAGEVVVGAGPGSLDRFADQTVYDFSDGVFFAYVTSIPFSAIMGAMPFVGRFAVAVFVDRPGRDLDDIVEQLPPTFAHAIVPAPLQPGVLKMSGAGSESYRAVIAWRA